MHKYILLVGLVVVLVGLFQEYTILGLFFLIIGILVVLYGFYSDEKIKTTPYVPKKKHHANRTRRKERSTYAYNMNVNRCPECGSKNPKNAAFCAQCGEKLRNKY